MQRDVKLDTSDAFHKLKPFCVNLIREQSKENVAALRRVLKLVDDSSCQALQEYVLFPLTLVFKNENKTEALLLETIECISDLLRRTSVSNWSIFSDVFLRLLLVVSSMKNGLNVSVASEEIKLAFTHGLQCLIQSAAPGILLQMFSIEFRLCLGHAVTILLALAEKERNRALQIASMECLADLTCHNVEDASNKPVLHYCCGNAFAGFFPGISIGLTHVIVNTEGRSQKTAAVALNTWAAVMEEVLSDTHLNYLKQEADVNELEPQSTSVSKVPRVMRTNDWVRSTAEKLHILVDRVLPCLSSCEQKTKLAALDWASVILLKCKMSLESLASPVLQLVLCLSADSDGKIALKSSSLLEEVANQMTQESLSLTEMLEEDFYRALGRFQHIIWTGSDKDKLTHVRLLSGYLTIFRAKVAKILLSSSVCERLLDVLFLLTDLDTSTISLLAEHAISPDFTDTMGYELRSYHRQFKHFSDIDIFNEFVRVCKLLGQYGDINLLVDILHQKIQGSATYRKQAILVLNHVLVSFRDNEDETPRSGPLNDNAYRRSLLEYYISQEMWNLPLQAEADSFGLSVTGTSYILSIDKINSNILQNCLLLEGVSIIASLMKQKFRPLLRICLCPLLEKADSSNHLVSHTACLALQCISKSCCYQSIPQLIQENIDYITDSLLFKLKHASSHPDIPHVVQALVKHGSRDAMRLVEDVGYEVLSALDFCHSENAMPFLRTLAGIVHFVARWFPPDPKQEEPNDLCKPKSASSFVRFVGEYHRCKQISENLVVSEEQLGLEEGDDQYPEPIEEEKKEAPGHVKLLVQILKRCVHLQSRSSIWIQTAVLTIIRHAVVPVSCCEDELLPVVHLLWKPLVMRFQRNDHGLSIKAFETLTSLVDTSGDFIRQRTLKEVWPKLADFLTNQHSTSRGKGKAYEITAAFKYQLALLQGLGPLSWKLKVDEQDITCMASVVVPYMELSQPEKLQLAAVNCTKELAKCAPDSVWFFVVKSYCWNHPPWSPSPHLHQIPFSETPDPPNQNVANVLKYLSSTQSTCK